jgi:hypothetical protein
LCLKEMFNVLPSMLENLFNILFSCLPWRVPCFINQLYIILTRMIILRNIKTALNLPLLWMDSNGLEVLPEEIVNQPNILPRWCNYTNMCWTEGGVIQVTSNSILSKTIGIRKSWNLMIIISILQFKKNILTGLSTIYLFPIHLFTFP